MAEAFDPYRKWLGIPPSQQPPHHYRLLGIEMFEADAEVIDTAAAQRMSYLQELSGGPHVKESQRLLNEVSAARRCLLDPKKKADYDSTLKAKLAADAPLEVQPLDETTVEIKQPKKAAAKPNSAEDEDDTIVINVGKSDSTQRGKLPGLAAKAGKDSKSGNIKPSFDGIGDAAPKAEKKPPVKGPAAPTGPIEIHARAPKKLKPSSTGSDRTKAAGDKSDHKVAKPDGHDATADRHPKPKRKKGGTGLLIGVGVAGMVVVAGGYFAIRGNKPSTAVATQPIATGTVYVDEPVERIAVVPKPTRPLAAPANLPSPAEIAAQTKAGSDTKTFFSARPTTAQAAAPTRTPAVAAAKTEPTSEKPTETKPVETKPAETTAVAAVTPPATSPPVPEAPPAAFRVEAKAALESAVDVRPHFVPNRNVLGQVQALFREGDDYHLFYNVVVTPRKTPGDAWGHAVSRDLITWRERPVAFTFDAKQPPTLGGVVVDAADTAKLGAEGRGAWIASYTAPAADDPKRHDVCLAYSRDAGATWTAYEKNPVLKGIKPTNKFPRIVRDEADKRWLMVFMIDFVPNDSVQYGVFASPDLKTWTKVQDIPFSGGAGGADFAPLATAEGQTRWMLTSANGHYFLLRFEDGKFFKEPGVGILHEGAGYHGYCSLAGGDPKQVVQVATMQSVGRISSPVAVSRPRVLKLQAAGDGFVAIPSESPLPEKWKAAPRSISNQELDPAAPVVLTVTDIGSSFRVDLRIEPGQAKAVEMIVFDEKYRFDFAEQLQTVKGLTAKFDAKLLHLNGIVDLELVEWTTGQNTRVAYVAAPGPGVIPLQIKADGGVAKIVQLQVVPLNPQPTILPEPASTATPKP